MKTLEVKIIDPVGIHARPATLFVTEANKFKSNIEIAYEDKKANLKSIMGVLSLGVPTQATVTLNIDGEDEEEALTKLSAFLKEQGLTE